MAGSQEFKQGMQGASKPKHRESDNYKMQGSHLIGGGAYDRQVSRESAGSNSGPQSSSTNSLQDYINISKSATQGNADFSVDSANKFTNNTREQSNVNKEQNKGFSDNRITNNSNFANAQQDRQAVKNEGFSMNQVNNSVNNAKGHREHNTDNAQQFANQSVQKYLNTNKANQSVNVNALDSNIRKAPMVDKAKGDLQGLNTYGDMYSYGRNNLPNYSMPDNPSKIEQPDFGGMYDKVTGDIEKQKLNT